MRERNSPGSVQRAVRKLRRIISNIARRDVMFELAGPSKDAHVVMMELPRVLDHMLHRLEMRMIKPLSDNAPIGNSDADELEKP